ncbi:MAG: glycosyltransferase family 39 protein [Candidatus Omnitrophota bacterium]
MDRDLVSNWTHRKIILILLGVSFIFLMFGNGALSLTHPDEVFYAQIAKEMIHHHSWMTPYIFDEPNFEKPIFFYWLMVAVIRLFGLSAFVARFWPACFGILGVILTYWMAFLLFKDKRTGFYSGMILASSFIYIALSRAILTDMVFSIWVVLALACFYWGYSDRKYKSLGIFLCFVVSGVAVLTKGILGFIFPFGIIFLFLLWKKELSFLKAKATALGVLALLAIVVPWHVLMVKLYGNTFFQEYWHNVHVRRIFDAEHQKSNTWYFYPLTMFTGVFPWSLFLVPAGWFVVKKVKQISAERDQFIFLFIWIIFVWMSMQVAASKLSSYVFPVFPALAILLGYYFAQLMKNKDDPFLAKSAKITQFIIVFICLVGGIAAILFSKQYPIIFRNMFPIYLFSLLLLACGVGLFILTRKSKYLQATGCIFSVAIIFLMSAFFGIPDTEPWVSCKQICDVFKTIDQSETTVLCSKFFVRGVRYYTDRDVAVMDSGEGFFSPHPVPYLNNDDKVRAFLDRQPFTYAIVKESNVKDLERICQNSGYELTHFWDIGGKYIVKVEKKAK